jgi:hypothetical protein
MENWSVRSGNHAQLTKLRYSLRQPPIGNACAHSALNDRWNFIG